MMQVTSVNILLIVDTGLPISLIKSDYVPIACHIPVESDYQFTGINGSQIKILDIFEKCLKINDVDLTMSSVALLGRDLIADPTITVEFGKTVKVSRSVPDITGEKDDFEK